MERIAAAARVNKQLLFHYFASKEGLFAAALESALARLEARSAPSDSPIEQLRRIVGELAAAFRNLPGLVGILADSRANPDFPASAAKALGVWRDGLLMRLGTVVQDGQRRGYFRDDVEPQVVSQVAVAAALGYAALMPAPSGGTSRPGAGFEEGLTRMLADYCAWR